MGLQVEILFRLARDDQIRSIDPISRLPRIDKANQPGFRLVCPRHKITSADRISIIHRISLSVLAIRFHLIRQPYLMSLKP